MMTDVRNIPFPGDQPPFGSSGTISLIQGGEYDGVLHLDNILLQEFNYASTTAYQAMEDRARLFNLYLLLVGVLASGLGAAYQIGTGVRPYLPPVAVVLLCVAGILGTAFFVSLIRLRQAHFRSLVCMGIIKEYYIRHFQGKAPMIDKIFVWRVSSAPPAERLGSATFVVCHTVAMIGSLCFAGAAAVITDLLQYNANLVLPQIPASLQPYMIGSITFIIFFLWQAIYFRRALRSVKDPKIQALIEELKQEAAQNL